MPDPAGSPPSFLPPPTEQPVSVPPPLAAPPPAVDLPPPTEAEKLQELARQHPETLDALRQRSAQMLAANAAQAAVGSNEIAKRLNAASADQTAQKTLFHQSIMTQGVLRSIDLSDTDLERAQDVLNRYGIRIEYLNVQSDVNFARPADGGYINNITTKSGYFIRPAGLHTGVYQMFTFGQVAEKRMAQLEEDELHRRKLDPARTRVTRVVFGLATNGAAYDLGVKNFEWEPVPDDKVVPDEKP